MRRILQRALRRLLFLPLTLFAVLTMSFLLLRLLPGDPAVQILGNGASAEDVDALRAELGLDQPVMQQYFSYLGDLARGDFGDSYRSGRPIMQDVVERLPATLELTFLAMAMTVVIGLLVGGIAAWRKGRMPDHIARGFMIVQQSVPDFVLALGLILVFFSVLQWAPTPVGRVAIGEGSPPPVTHFFFIDSLLAGRGDLFISGLQHAILPAAAIGLLASAGLAKTARSAIGEALASPQVEFARACGLPSRQVFRYALTTARIPLLTFGAMLLANLIGGTVIIESIFSWNGFAQWGLDAIYTLDLPAVQAFIVVTGTLSILLYVVLDLLVLALDPRVNL